VLNYTKAFNDTLHAALEEAALLVSSYKYNVEILLPVAENT
jgi:hypothetical protein